MKPIGFIVIESTDEYEQTLALVHGEGIPKLGLLDWASGKNSRSIFLTTNAARAAIERTEHYRLAFDSNHPEKKYCKIAPISIEEAEAPKVKP